MGQCPGYSGAGKGNLPELQPSVKRFSSLLLLNLNFYLKSPRSPIKFQIPGRQCVFLIFKGTKLNKTLL